MPGPSSPGGYPVEVDFDRAYEVERWRPIANWLLAIPQYVVLGIFGAGLLYWGNRFKNMRRTTIIFYGIGGGA